VNKIPALLFHELALVHFLFDVKRFSAARVSRCSSAMMRSACTEALEWQALRAEIFA